MPVIGRIPLVSWKRTDEPPGVLGVSFVSFVSFGVSFLVPIFATIGTGLELMQVHVGLGDGELMQVHVGVGAVVGGGELVQVQVGVGVALVMHVQVGVGVGVALVMQVHVGVGVGVALVMHVHVGVGAGELMHWQPGFGAWTTTRKCRCLMWRTCFLCFT